LQLDKKATTDMHRDRRQIKTETLPAGRQGYTSLSVSSYVKHWYAGGLRIESLLFEARVYFIQIVFL